MKLALLSVSFMLLTVFTPFSDAVEKAEKENKQVLLVFSGSDWCAPCISLKKKVLDGDEFQAYQEDKLVLYVADFPRDRSLISNEQIQQNEVLADTYNARGAFPYFVVIDGDGEVVKQRAGTFNTFTELKQWLEN